MSVILTLLHLDGLRPRVYYTLINFRGGGQGPLPPVNTPMLSNRKILCYSIIYIVILKIVLSILFKFIV